MDLTKMSVEELYTEITDAAEWGDAGRLAKLAYETHHRLAAAEAENDNLIFTLHRIINSVPCIDPNDGTFFVCHFDEDGNEIGVTHFQEGQIVDQILKIAREAAQRPNAGGRE